MPPAIAAKTICSDTATPATVSGLTYWMYWVKRLPPSAVNAALTIVTRSFSRITSIPTEAAAISSSEMASSATRSRPASIQRHAARPPSQTARAKK